MPRKPPQTHSAAEFDLAILENETDMFRWFLLCYLFGKPIQSAVAVNTWTEMIAEMLDTPWAIAEASEHQLVQVLRRGGYTRYQHVTADGLRVCMERLIREYEGSLYLMLESSADEDEFAKRLQQLYGVGPKITEIFVRDVAEYFARRIE